MSFYALRSETPSMDSILTIETYGQYALILPNENKLSIAEMKKLIFYISCPCLDCVSSNTTNK